MLSYIYVEDKAKQENKTLMQIRNELMSDITNFIHTINHLYNIDAEVDINFLEIEGKHIPEATLHVNGVLCKTYFHYEFLKRDFFNYIDVKTNKFNMFR